jgi:hypothetical protein
MSEFQRSAADSARPGKRRRRALAAAVAVLSTLGATVLVGTLGGGAAAAATPCSVSYQVDQWSGGFTATVGVTDNGAALTSWTVTWSFDGNQEITSAWDAQVTQTGEAVTAANEAYNGTVAAGGTIDLGFQATWSGTNDAPANFALDGASCEGGTTSPSASPTPSMTASATATATSSPTATASASASGTGGSASPTTSAPPPAGCPSGVIFCDGFENQTSSVPSGRWSVYTLDCSGTGTASIDDTVAHTGTKSAKIVGYDGYCNHVFIRDANDMGLAGPVWDVRFWVMHTTPLPTGHVTFVAMNDSSENNTDLRFGGQDGALMWNRQADDQTLPDQSPAGVAESTALPVNTWSCVELQVNGSNGDITTWVNGNQIAGLSENGTPVANVSDQWLAGSGASWRPKLTDLKFGWESYGGGGNDTLWFDDIALSTTRIGC